MPYAAHRLALAGSLLAALLAVQPAAAQVVSPPPPPTQEQVPTGIEVLGEGTVRAAPTLARVTLGVEVFAPTLSAAQSEAVQRMQAVIQQLLQAGVPEANIRTVRFDIQPVFRMDEPPPRPQAGQPEQPQLQGFRVTNLVEVRTTNLGRLGQLIDQAVNAGATRVENIQLDIAEPAQLRQQALAQAFRRARDQAQVLAQEAGVTLGPPVLIQEAEVGGFPPAFGGARALAAEAQTPIQPGETEVRAAVRVRFAIQ